VYPDSTLPVIAVPVEVSCIAAVSTKSVLPSSVIVTSVCSSLFSTFASSVLFGNARYPIPPRIRRIIIPVIIFIVMTSSGNTDEQSLPENYNRLPNGIIISSLIRNSVGLGTLEIDNGTDNDAVAKLINKKKNISVSTVYIQAKSKFTITKIPDGTYELYFQTGKDWNEKENKFLFLKEPDNFILVGGGIEKNETPEQAIKREILEEFGIKSEIGRLLYVNNYIEKDGINYIEFFFEIKNVKDFISIDSFNGIYKDELSEIVWKDQKDEIKILPEQIKIDFQNGKLLEQEVKFVS